MGIQEQVRVALKAFHGEWSEEMVARKAERLIDELLSEFFVQKDLSSHLTRRIVEEAGPVEEVRPLDS